MIPIIIKIKIFLIFFCKIFNIVFYIICYVSNPSLWSSLFLKVSKTRKEVDLREVFDEAEQNTEKPISDVISDGWGATQTMTNNIGREITHVIHKHKKPYKKVVARHYSFTKTDRIISEIGIKNDVFKKKGKREFYYTVSKTPLNPPPSKKRGRSLGSKK